MLDPHKYVASGQTSYLDIHAWRVDERGTANDVPFQILSDSNKAVTNILEHLKRQSVLKRAVSQIIYSLNPRLERSITEMLDLNLGGALAGGRGVILKKTVLLGVLIQALVMIGIILIVWSILIII